MGKLDQYLDQVCRGIGGPRSLRQHIRQELREHLLDAAATHRASGMSEEHALARALEDFGGPDQVRSELEATHGHRLMAVLIDKAMQWKEKTMKAKWLWMTWAHLALVLVIALALSWIVFASLFITPKFQRLMRDGLVDPAILDTESVSWMPSYLQRVQDVGDHATPILLIAVVAWGLFEWRVRSENKAFIRLSALGTVAVGLLVVGVLMAGSLVISFCLGVPALGKVSQLFAMEQIASVDTSLGALEKAQAKQDWEAMQEQTDRASRALQKLAGAAPAVGAITPMYSPPTLDELRAQVRTANDDLVEVQQAIRAKDAARLDAAIRTFHKSYGPIKEAAKKKDRRES